MEEDSCDSAKCLYYEEEPSSRLATSLYSSRFLSSELNLARESEGLILESSNFLLKNIGKCESKKEVPTQEKNYF